ncbi:MAG TPA: transporter, partial [Hyphomicrobiaceae bacterium]|nr:transporter [Hyphomicrobiaceae bacterium]
IATPAFAHHPSGVSSTGGAGPIATISASTLEQGASAAGIFFEMVKISPFSDAQLETFAGQHVHVHSLDAILAPTLVYAYGVTRNLTVSVRLPVLMREDIREGHHSHGPAGNTIDVRGDTAGLGDASVLGQYRFLGNKATGTEAALLVGVKLPTGKTNAYDADGERFEAEFQPGSGSWDGLIGLAATQRVGLWSFDANVLYQLVTKGARDTDLGDRFLYNAAVSYRVVSSLAAPAGRMSLGALPAPMYHGGPASHGRRHAEAEQSTGPSLDLVLEINGEWHGHTVEGGVKDANSGGNVIYLSPGLRVSNGNWSAFASVGVPIARDMYGIQAEPDWRLLSGVAVRF